MEAEGGGESLPSVTSPGAAGADAEQGGFRASCWACGVVVALQVDAGGAPPSTWKCGWCGAVSEPGRKQQHGRARGARRGNPLWAVLAGAGKAVVVVVYALVSAIGFVGVRWVVPVAASSAAGRAVLIVVATMLIGLVLVSYSIVLVADPGRPPKTAPQRSVGLVQRGAFEGLRWCVPCDAPKPVGAHHCRLCACCVIDMDHHCPFVAGCVGAGNLRAFLVFLFWATLGCSYAVVVCLYACAMRWDEVSSHLFSGTDSRRYAAWERMHSKRPVRGGMLGLLDAAWEQLVYVAMWFSKLDTWPPWLLALAFDIFAAGLVAVLVGSLLWSQLSYLREGQTYVDSLQGGATKREGTREDLVSSLRAVFGKGHPLTWAVPRLRPPVGARTPGMEHKAQ